MIINLIHAHKVNIAHLTLQQIKDNAQIFQIHKMELIYSQVKNAL